MPWQMQVVVAEIDRMFRPVGHRWSSLSDRCSPGFFREEQIMSGVEPTSIADGLALIAQQDDLST